MAHETTYLRAAARFMPAGGKDGERRTIWRLRGRHMKDASRAVQHMRKALTKMKIQLADVISDISGVSGQPFHFAIDKLVGSPFFRMNHHVSTSATLATLPGVERPPLRYRFELS
jgi:hypothetical protein